MKKILKTIGLVPAGLYIFSLCANAATYYVSRNGNNAGGLSWATAWNNFAGINTASLQPGDTVYIDGGGNGMVYEATLDITNVHGGPGAPVTICLSSEAGRNGRVYIRGPRWPIMMPYCGENDYSYTGANPRGINISGSSWIVLDGMKWRGIVVESAESIGVGGNDLLIRNLEIFDCGNWGEAEGMMCPGGNAVEIGDATNVNFERVIIQNTGADAFGAGPAYNMKVKECWFFTKRLHPDGDKRYNYVKHSDAMQMYACSQCPQGPLSIEDSIIGPGWMMGIFLGGPFDDVTFRNVLFYGNMGSGNIFAQDAGTLNWKVYNVTAHCIALNDNRHFMFDGSGFEVRDSIFYGAKLGAFGGTTACSGNYYWNVEGAGSNLGTEMDPLFVAPPPSGQAGYVYGFLNNPDFALQPGSPAQGKGSRVTSVGKFSELFGLDDSYDDVNLQFSAENFKANELDGTATVTVARTRNSRSAVSIQYATSNATAQAGQDYTSKSGTLSWADGDMAAKTFTIGIIDDSAGEGNETICLSLSSPGGGAVSGLPSGAVLNIVDNDVNVQVSGIQASSGKAYVTADIAVGNEYYIDRSYTIASIPYKYEDYIWIKTANGDKGYTSDSFLSFYVNRPVSVYVGHHTGITPKPAWLGTFTDTGDNITGSAGAEYRLYEKTFPAGTVILGGNTVSGGTLDMYIVLLTGVVSVSQPGSLQFSASSYNAAESGGNAAITVSRLGGTTGAVSVQYTTSNGTAQAAVDYTAASGTFNWADGDSEAKTFTVAVINDLIINNTRIINLILSNVSGGAVLGSPAAAVLTITDDDIMSGDFTPPAAVVQVRDGASADIEVVTSSTALSANWDEASDVQSGIERYWYAIGTVPGGVDVVGWTDNDKGLSVTRTGLLLKEDSTYYFTVKAENGAGLQSAPANSDGQCVIFPAVAAREKITVKHLNLCPLSRNGEVKFQVNGTVGSGELRIYTITGKLVKTLVMDSGNGEINWRLVNEQGHNIRPGIYLYALSDSSGNKKTGKVVISR